MRRVESATEEKGHAKVVNVEKIQFGFCYVVFGARLNVSRSIFCNVHMLKNAECTITSKHPKDHTIPILFERTFYDKLRCLR